MLFFAESETIQDIVLEQTGFDLREVTKEELHKETKDEALSVINFTPEPVEVPEEIEEEKEETVSKTVYDQLKVTHRDEIQQLQDEYE